MEWINPHSWIHLAVKNADGTTTEWMIEGGTPNTLVRRGFTKRVAAAGHRDYVWRASARRTAPIAPTVRTWSWPDGKRLFLGSSGTGDPNSPDGR